MNDQIRQARDMLEGKCPSNTLCSDCLWFSIKGIVGGCNPETAKEVAREYLDSQIEFKAW